MRGAWRRRGRGPSAGWQRAGLTPQELYGLLDENAGSLADLEPRTAAAGRYAATLSATPVILDEHLVLDLKRLFSDRELVVLATTIAQVNYWARFSQGLGIPPAGFFDAASCPRPTRETP